MVCLLACSAENGRSSQSRRSASQSSANASTYAAQLAPSPAPSESIASIWARAAATGQVELGAVLEDVAGDRLDRDQLDLLLQGAAGLAEEVTQHGGQERVGRPGVPAEAVLLDEAHRPTEPWSGLEQGHVVAVLGQPGGARQPAVPPADHHHA